MNFGVLIFNQVEELDFVGPWEMLTTKAATYGHLPASLLRLAPFSCWHLLPALTVKRPRGKYNWLQNIIPRRSNTAVLRITPKCLLMSKTPNALAEHWNLSSTQRVPECGDFFVPPQLTPEGKAGHVQGERRPPGGVSPGQFDPPVDDGQYQLDHAGQEHQPMRGGAVVVPGLFH